MEQLLKYFEKQKPIRITKEAVQKRVDELAAMLVESTLSENDKKNTLIEKSKLWTSQIDTVDYYWIERNSNGLIIYKTNSNNLETTLKDYKFVEFSGDTVYPTFEKVTNAN